MRKFQISIGVELFEGDGAPRKLLVYADANDLWETIYKGFSAVVNTLQSNGFLPYTTIGCREVRWDTTGVERRHNSG